MGRRDRRTEGRKYGSMKPTVGSERREEVGIGQSGERERKREGEIWHLTEEERCRYGTNKSSKMEREKRAIHSSFVVTSISIRLS